MFSANYHPAKPTDAVVGACSERPILIVEDDAGVSTMLSMALEEANYAVQIAANGYEALEQIKRQRPRLILLDLRMPVMDGPTLLKALRADTQPPPPVIVMTAYREIDAEVERMNLPSIGKPMKLDELLLLIERHAEP
jgi:two-component system, response regulator, stage 0 sporulation protein F